MTPFSIALECRQRDNARKALDDKLSRTPPGPERDQAGRDGREAIRQKFARLDRALIRYAIDNSGVPSENNPAGFDYARLSHRWNFDNALAAWKSDEREKDWLYIAGPSGRGKSWAASAIMAYEAENGEGFDLWQTAEAGYNRATEDAYAIDPEFLWLPGSVLKERLAEKDGKAEIIRRCSEAGFLCIDDLFHNVSGPFLESFRRILAERPEHMPTVITSNYRPIDVLRRSKGKDYLRTLEAVVRRLVDRCDVLSTADEPEVNF